MKHMLRELRLGKGLTQQEVANHLGMPFKTYNALERGYRGKLLDRGLSLAFKIAGFYEKPVEEVFGKEGEAVAVQSGRGGPENGGYATVRQNGTATRENPDRGGS